LERKIITYKRLIEFFKKHYLLIASCSKEQTERAKENALKGAKKRGK